MGGAARPPAGGGRWWQRQAEVEGGSGKRRQAASSDYGDERGTGHRMEGPPACGRSGGEGTGRDSTEKVAKHKGKRG